MVDAPTIMKVRKWSFFIGFPMFLLGMGLLILLPIINLFSNGTQNAPAAEWIPILALLPLFLSLLLVIYWLLTLAVIGISKNDGNYKTMWLLLVFILGILGAGLWDVAGKKDLKLK